MMCKDLDLEIKEMLQQRQEKNMYKLISNHTRCLTLPSEV